MLRTFALRLDGSPLLRSRTRRARRGGRQVRYVSTPFGDVRARAQPSPVGPRLLFAVDCPNVHEHYDALLEHLEGRADVVIFEPPGTGGSAPGPRFDFRLDSFVTLTEVLLHELGPRTLVFPCYLGLVAQAVARRSPLLAPRIVLPQTVHPEDFLRWAKRVDPRHLLRTPLLGQALVAARRRSIARIWYRASVGHAECREPFTRTALERLDAGGWYCLASLMQALSVDLRREAGGAASSPGVPAAILWGPEDRTHRASDPTRALAGAEIVRFEKSGHCPELEEPERFASWLLGWHGATV